MWFIIVADVTMSTDNILAMAALAQGNFELLLFGLGVSIPLVVFASGLLATLMDRYPVIVYIGAALLGRVAGQMIMTDAFVVQRFAPSEALRYSVEAAGTIGVLMAGWWLKRRASSLRVSAARSRSFRGVYRRFAGSRFSARSSCSARCQSSSAEPCGRAPLASTARRRAP